MEGTGYEMLHDWRQTFLEDQKRMGNPKLQPE